MAVPPVSSLRPSVLVDPNKKPEKEPPPPPPTFQELNRLCLLPIAGTLLGVALTVYSLTQAIISAIGMLYCHHQKNEDGYVKAEAKCFKAMHLMKIGVLQASWVGAIYLVVHDEYPPKKASDDPKVIPSDCELVHLNQTPISADSNVLAK